MSDWQITDLKSSTSEVQLRSTSPGKMWWHTQHSADFGNWVSIKGLLSQREMCHVAKSSFYDAVCLVSFKACKTLARKKKNTELVDFLTVSCGVKAVTSLGDLLSTADSLEFREKAVPWRFYWVTRKTHSKHQCCGGFTDWAMMGGTIKMLVFCLSSDVEKNNYFSYQL